MKDLDITAVYIPDSCTRYVQPIDSIINKLVKDKISDILEETKLVMILVLDTVELQPHMQLQQHGYGFINLSRILLSKPFSKLEFHSVQVVMMIISCM